MRFITALNTISSPILAVLVIIIGCGYSILSKKYGLDGNTAAGIVGAGIGLLTGQVLSVSKQQSAVVQVSPAPSAFPTTQAGQ